MSADAIAETLIARKLFTANLAVKVRWPIAKTVGVLLAGTIPLVGIIVEHFQTQAIKEQFGV